MKKKVLSILLALCLLLSLAPMPAMAVETGTSDGVDSYEKLCQAINDANSDTSGSVTILITGDFEVAGPVPAIRQGFVTIKSKGPDVYTITRGRGFEGELLSTDSKCDPQIYLSNITLDGGWKDIDGVQASAALIKVAGQTMMKLGEGVTLQNNNNNNGSGGAVCIDSGLCTMTGVSITGNTANNGGGVYNKGIFTMTGVSITGDSAESGGGVYNKGTFTMNGGIIADNYAAIGGGVYSDETFTMKSGTISLNTGEYGGGGVYNTGSGTFNMSGSAKITGNTAKGDNCGGGVYNENTMNLSGNAQITGNTSDGTTASNVYLPEGKTITLTGALGTSASIGVTAETMPATIAKGDDSYAGGITDDDVAKFKPDNAEYVLQLEEGQLKLCANEAQIGDQKYTSLSKAVTEAKEGDTIEILSNLTLTGTISVKNGITITSADSVKKPYTITRGDGFKDEFFNVNSGGALTLTNITLDGNKKNIEAEAPLINVADGGKLTLGDKATLQNNNNKYNNNDDIGGKGGGVLNKGTLTMNGGTITGNTANMGGGVLNESTFTMSDGAEITGNTAREYGGGVHNANFISCTCTMSGGSITNNSANNNGGGVYNASNFTMSEDAEITGNKANVGGGVYNENKMKLGGDVQITGNTVKDGTTASNVYLTNGEAIILTRALTGEKKIGVSVADAPKSCVIATADANYTGGITDSDVAKFVSESTDYDAPCLENKEIVLKRYPNVAQFAGTKYTSLQKAVDAANVAYKATEIQLLGDVTLNTAIAITNKYGVTITSAEGSTYSITRDSGYMGAFFNVHPDCSLTLKNITLDGGWDNVNNKGIKSANSLIIVREDGALTLNDGATLQNNYSSGNGGAVYIYGGTFTMNDGSSITGNSAANGGGVYILGDECDAKFIMNGGSITGNTASIGGGIYDNSGFCKIFGESSIEQNIASDKGGGVYLAPNSGASFTMTGGGITGGSITGNKAPLGGGVFGDELNGCGYGEFKISGKVQISGNTLPSSTTASNVYLAHTQGMRIPNMITLTDHLKDESLIGISTQASPTDDAPLTVIKAGDDYTGQLTADDAAKFFSDSDAYGVRLNSTDNQIELATQYKVTFDRNGRGEADPDAKFVIYNQTATAPTAPTVTGYTISGWYKEEKCENEWKFDTEPVTEATTLYAKWTANTYTVKFDPNGGKGEMKDETFTYDAAQALTKNAFTRGGYAFDGWNDAKDGKGTSYKDSASVKNLKAENGASVTLYAQWKAVKVDAGKVSGGASQVAGPAPAAGATAAQKDAMQKATDALNASGVQASGLDKAVSVKKNANGDFTVDTGAKKPVTVKKTELDKIMGEKHLTGASTLAAKPFLKIQVTAADVDDAAKITTLTFDIKPYVKLCLMSGGKPYEVSTEALENVTKPVTITLTLPDGFTVPAGYKIVVLHTKADGTKYTYDVTRDGNQITFVNPNGFSTFTVQTVPISAKTENTAPKTGDSSHMALWGGLTMAAACGAAYVVLHQRRKKERDQ